MSYETFVFTCTYRSDVDKFKQLLTEKNAHFCTELQVPFWNVWGDTVFKQWAIVYQYDHSIDMEILC
jgi:hypothetical protein